jgi:regulator of Ty1 transposition protein 109
MTSLPVSSLRAHLLSSLTSLPGSRIFHIHVLVSSPRKPARSLFRYASPRPNCQLQDILILLSEEAVPVEKTHGSASNEPPAAISRPRTFVSAIEACVYTFPTSDSTILYISKVDGTGQGIFPSPTSSLLRAFGVFYASPRSPVYTAPTTHHLWIHLFARSQRQYLFPNSGDHPNKKPLGDVALCKWWKQNLSDIAKAVEDTNDVKTTGVPIAGEYLHTLSISNRL